ncbi:MAG: thiamine phosphate synthase [Tetragenococcus halophilus]|uniref:thiamine phosphate synthase n=1 Tax=Tetragenococcus halophilus TaxID=51669 RepID=UPI00083D6488|nr:thiamine phosphate synthase [Tetragenococcus halophilus]AOF47979.1 thiamine-phosphate pyrophosphorylase [Tetragenococcus halophilus]MCO8288419.1 thiamine phosphate synthase [Tetragenococcus halophilus]MDN6128148.1 thiamine phosphate synthase [Tetragenococcus halophilus]MDN6723117.1 thiamine phosphate synthase [Tetragenococcus halophilus]GBD60410.1 thiamine-phosphate pyrophosphorylase [Tetragenococcus halophilus subsp. halophilus]
MKIDTSLYLVTNRYGESEPIFLQKIEEACKNGVTLVQLREKELTTSAYYKLAQKVKNVTDAYQIPLIIDDRVDICLAIDASGVHIGDDELPVEVTRQLIGNKILGVSAKNVSQAKKAQLSGADYLGIGAMFSTTTKKDAQTTSFETLQQITQEISIPVVAIGGITEERITNFNHINIQGIAIVSEIMKASNIGEKVGQMRTKFTQLEGK